MGEWMECRWPDGTEFAGEVLNGSINGYGRIVYGEESPCSGDVYEGEWKDNLPSGQGIYRWRDGGWYEGEFVFGKPDGIGVCVWPDHGAYVGEWAAGAMTGKGTYAGNDCVVDGAFREGWLQGGGVRVSFSHGSVRHEQFTSGQFRIPNTQPTPTPTTTPTPPTPTTPSAPDNPFIPPQHHHQHHQPPPPQQQQNNIANATYTPPLAQTQKPPQQRSGQVLIMPPHDLRHPTPHHLNSSTHVLNNQQQQQQFGTDSGSTNFNGGKYGGVPDIGKLSTQDNHQQQQSKPAGVFGTTPNEQALKETMLRKQKHIVKEIIETERTYVSQLEMLIGYFVNPLKQPTKPSATPLKRRGSNGTIEPPKLDRDSHIKMFANLDVIHMLSKQILSTLEKGTAKNGGEISTENVVSTFVTFGPTLKIYAPYISDYNTIHSLVKHHRSCTKGFAKYAQMCRPHCGGLDLESLLITPVQRIPRYRLLFQELLNTFSDDDPLLATTQEALSLINEAAVYLNEERRSKEMHDKLQDIAPRISGLPDAFDLIFKVLIREGGVFKMCRRGPRPYWLLLLEDGLLYAEETSVASLHHQLKFKRFLKFSNGFCVRDKNVGAGADDTAFDVLSPEKSFVVLCDDTTAREMWLTAFKRAPGFVVSEDGTEISTPPSFSTTPLPLSHYAPIWVPDGSATRCSVCQSEFTFARRRHHCRRCGKLICSQCSRETTSSPLLPDAKQKIRVCSVCSQRLVVDISNPILTSASSLFFSTPTTAAPPPTITASTSAGALGHAAREGFSRHLSNHRSLAESLGATAHHTNPSRSVSPIAHRMNSHPVSRKHAFHASSPNALHLSIGSDSEAGASPNTSEHKNRWPSANAVNPLRLFGSANSSHSTQAQVSPSSSDSNPLDSERDINVVIPFRFFTDSNSTASASDGNPGADVSVGKNGNKPANPVRHQSLLLPPADLNKSNQQQRR